MDKITRRGNVDHVYSKCAVCKDKSFFFSLRLQDFVRIFILSSIKLQDRIGIMVQKEHFLSDLKFNRRLGAAILKKNYFSNPITGSTNIH